MCIGVAALLAGYEFYHIMWLGGYKPSYVVGLGLIAVLLFDVYYPHYGVWRWGVAAAVILLLLRQLFRQDAQGFLANWALTLAGALYVGGLLGHMIALRNLPNGLTWLLLTCMVTWLCDTAAYLVGSRWGKHGFFTHISPHKTWEGAIAGFACGIATAMFGGRYLALSWWQSLILGILLVVGLTAGDLAESLIKRQVGVKDSSHLIPGHGGMLDRIDSLLFAGTISYYFAIWVMHVGAL